MGTWSPKPLLQIPQDLIIQSCLPQILDWLSSPVEGDSQVAVAERESSRAAVEDVPSRMTLQCVQESPGRTPVCLAAVYACWLLPFSEICYQSFPGTTVLPCS